MNLKKSEGKVGVDRECLLWNCLVVEGRVKNEENDFILAVIRRSHGCLSQLFILNKAKTPEEITRPPLNSF